MSKKKEALGAFLQKKVENASDYPPSIKLPPGIQETLTDATAKTEAQQCEHSVNFDYQRGRWVAGALKKGTRNRENILHKSIITPFQRALIHGHTHVPPLIDLAPRSRLLPGSKESGEKEFTLASAMQGLPSLQDARGDDVKTCGSIADIIVSTSGYFVIVRNTLTPRTFSSRQEAMAFSVERWNSIERLRSKIEKLKLEDDPKEIRKVIALEIARAFRNVHTCYFSSAPEVATLTKIKV